MALNDAQRQEIQALLRRKLDEKLKKYSRETSFMPFLVKIMQDANQVAACSFVHSLSTTLGMSIYAEISRIIVQETAREAFTSLDVGGVISDNQRNTIERIIEELKTSRRIPDANAEKNEVLAASTEGASPQRGGKIADFYYLADDGVKRYFEIKTAKPNIDVFTASKRKLLEWIARKGEDMAVFLALPYNPYHPKPYSHFARQNLFQEEGDLLVAEQYWGLLSGEEGTLESLLAVFDEIGKEYKEAIAEKIDAVSRRGQNFL